jgi:hypothetical protein
MKLSLLQMVQSVLAAMDSDNVNSISDTPESEQVAILVREAYFDLMSARQWPHLRVIDNLQGLSDVNNPTKMEIPDNINKIYWIKYNKKDVHYLTPAEFRSMIVGRLPLAGVVDSNGYVINQDPLYWTSYDDRYIVFDGYLSTTDNTLNGSKSEFHGVKAAGWTHVDSFIPDLPDKWFPTLLAESKAQSFVNLKQQANAREERKSQRGKTELRNESWKNKLAEERSNSAINYGRR